MHHISYLSGFYWLIGFGAFMAIASFFLFLSVCIDGARREKAVKQALARESEAWFERVIGGGQ